MGRRELVIVAAITALAGIARFSTLDLQSFHHDEAVTAGKVLAPGLLDTLEQVRDGERSPPLYYILAWAWSKLFGTGEVGLRSLSALIGTLTVPAAYLAGSRLAAPRVGLLAAALVALNPYLVWYSQEARSYILMVLFSTLALAYFASSLRQPEPRRLVPWAAFSALAVLSHYFAVFLLIPQAAWLLLAHQRRAQVALAVGATVLVALALLPFALAQQGEGRRDAFTERALPARAGETLLNFVASEEPDPLSSSARIGAVQAVAGVGGSVLFLGALGLLVGRGTPGERWGASLVGVVAAGGLVLPLGLAIVGQDFANPRNMIGGLPPLLCAGAIGFGGRGSGWPGRLGAVATCGLFAAVLIAVSVSAQMQRTDWRGAADALGSASAPRLIVAPRNGDDPLAYYLEAQAFDGKRFRERGVRVRELDLLSTTYLVGDPPRAFRLDELRPLAPTFFLRRFVARQPQLVKPKDVSRRNVLRERSVAFVQGFDFHEDERERHQ